MRWTRIGALVCAAGLVAAIPLAAQSSSRAGTASAKTGAVPRTPWGDPDLQGTWSTADLRGVPLQRPDEFAGRGDLSDQEFSQRLSTNQDSRTRELNRVGAFRNDVGTRTFRMTSLIVEPADGKIPPLTPEAQARTDAVAARRRSAPASWFDRSFYDRCITRGVLGSVLTVI